MKHKLLKLNAVLLLGLGLTPLQGQTTMTVKQTSGIQTAYTLSGIRKLTFPTSGNMTVSKTTASTDNYALTSIRYLKFGDTGTGIKSIADKGSLWLYPNPVVDILNIEFPILENHTYILEILSIEGKLLYKTHVASTSIIYQVNISQFRQGIYLCRINNGICIETTKFFKQ
jgi:hypothetical protein